MSPVAIGIVGLVATLPGMSFAIVNDTRWFDILLSACGDGELTVFNLGFEPIALRDGTVVPPAGMYPGP